jgi:hypothetical protein
MPMIDVRHRTGERLRQARVGTVLEMLDGPIQRRAVDGDGPDVRR